MTVWRFIRLLVWPPRHGVCYGCGWFKRVRLVDISEDRLYCERCMKP
jgi:hypothetical protein